MLHRVEGKVKVTEDIEVKLNGYFRPVNPEEDFIEKLHNRLFNKPKIIIEYPDYVLLILFICLSFTFGIGLIWLISCIFKENSEE